MSPFPQNKMHDPTAVDSGRSSDCKESSPFLDSESTDSLDHSRYPEDHHRIVTTRRRSWILPLIVGILSAILSSALTGFFIMRRVDGQCQHMKNRPSLDRWLPADSPLLEIDRSIQEVTFHPWNFTPSVWNEHPRYGRVDELWASKLGVHNHFFMIPLDRGADYNLDPRVHVTLKDVEGPVSEGFPVNIEGIHQLHCLDALRRKLFMNRDWYMKNWEVTAQYGMEEAHTSHCLDMLRQVITCRADLGVLGWKWVKTKGNSLPDFARPHMCNNFDSLRDWSTAHQARKSIQHYEDAQTIPENAILADFELFHGDLSLWQKTGPDQD